MAEQRALNPSMKVRILPKKHMKAIEYLKKLRDDDNWIHLPLDPSGKTIDGKVSNSSLRRWLDSKGVCINKEYPKANDRISFPVTSLVFFPKGKRKTTLL